MEGQPKYQSSERRVDTTELRDSDEVRLHLGNPDLLTIENARKAAFEAAEKKLSQEPVRQPHELSKGFSQGIIRLRVIRQSEALGRNTAEKSWDNFEVTR